MSMQTEVFLSFFLLLSKEEGEAAAEADAEEAESDQRWPEAEKLLSVYYISIIVQQFRGTL